MVSAVSGFTRDMLGNLLGRFTEHKQWPFTQVSMACKSSKATEPSESLQSQAPGIRGHQRRHVGWNRSETVTGCRHLR
jgi:hypothetical protein